MNYSVNKPRNYRIVMKMIYNNPNKFRIHKNKKLVELDNQLTNGRKNARKLGMNYQGLKKMSKC